MSETEEMAQKAYYANQQQAQAGMAGQSQTLRQDCGEAKTASTGILDRAASQFHRATSAARRRDQMAELVSLLQKYPEIARILDLVKELDSKY